jgi:hypothetical protein
MRDAAPVIEPYQKAFCDLSRAPYATNSHRFVARNAVTT